MKRVIYVTLVACLWSKAAMAQKVTEDRIAVNKSEAVGFIATSDYSVAQVQQVMDEEVQKAGLKRHGKNKKFYTIRGAEWPMISANKVDVYYKVQKKKHHSRIYFVVSKGYDNFITSQSDATIAANITAFLSGIDVKVAHNEELKAKEAEVIAANAKLEQDKANMQKAEADKNKKEKELQEIKADK